MYLTDDFDECELPYFFVAIKIRFLKHVHNIYDQNKFMQEIKHV